MAWTWAVQSFTVPSALEIAASPRSTACTQTWTAGETAPVGWNRGVDCRSVGWAALTDGPGLRRISDTTAQPAPNRPTTHTSATSAGRAAERRCLRPRAVKLFAPTVKSRPAGNAK
jgi:hypothetical protein